MRRIVVITISYLAAGTVAIVPAVIGLAGNPSFSHQLPVRVPHNARSITVAAATSSGREPDARLPHTGEDRHLRDAGPGDHRRHDADREHETVGTREHARQVEGDDSGGDH